jgi:hypothetical protein
MNSIVHSPWIDFAQALFVVVGTWLLAFGLMSVRESKGFDTSNPNPLAWRFWAGLVVLTLAAVPSVLHPFVPPIPSQERSNVPSAAESFTLRSKCAELGEKILAGNIIGGALTQSQVSHYNPATNRCYVELDVHMADLDKFDEYNTRNVFDGQTGEMLARIENKKGKQTAFLKDGPYTYDIALQKIESLMADDGKQ